MVKLYYTAHREKLPHHRFCSYLKLLPEAVALTVTALPRWQDQQAGLMGKLLLRQALEEAGMPEQLSQISYHQFGRPYLKGGPDFSISHSGCLTVCAVNFRGGIGADIEEMKPADVTQYRDVFTASEWQQICTSASPAYWFYYYWTAKEAVLKGLGEGLQLDLQQVPVSAPATTCHRSKWFLHQQPLYAGYMLHLATTKPLSAGLKILQKTF